MRILIDFLAGVVGIMFGLTVWEAIREFSKDLKKDKCEICGNLKIVIKDDSGRYLCADHLEKFSA